MEAKTLIEALGGMILTAENTSEETGFFKEFLIDIKSTLEMQEAKITQCEQETNHLKEVIKYACEMISIGENNKANNKMCEALGVSDDYFD